MQKKSYIVTGIDIGTHAVRVVVAGYDKNSGSSNPIILGTGIAESRGLRHGYIVNVSEAVRSIRLAVGKAEKSAGMRLRRAFVSIGGMGLEGSVCAGSTMVARADQEITDLDMEKAILSAEKNIPGFQNKKIIYHIPLSYRLDGKESPTNPVGMRGSKIEIKTLFITALEKHLNNIIMAVEEAGIAVEDVFPAPVAASYVTLSRQQKIAGCVLANIGAETVSVVVFENDIPTSLKVFPLGSNDITNDIALGLKISLEDAEDIKLGKIIGESGKYPRKTLEEIIEARMTDIFELIDAHLKKIDRSGLLPAGIVITGGGAGMRRISELAKGSLNLPSGIGYPAMKVRERKSRPGKQDSESMSAVADIKNIPAWTVAYGLCILGNGSTSERREWGKLVRGYLRRIVEFVKQFLP